MPRQLHYWSDGRLSVIITISLDMFCLFCGKDTIYYYGIFMGPGIPVDPSLSLHGRKTCSI